RVEQSDCVYLMKDQTTSSSVNKGRLKMYSNTKDEFLFLMLRLTPHDAGIYRFGVGEEKSSDIELSVRTDACCGGIERKTVFLGDTVTVSCKYPPEFTPSKKLLISISDQNNIKSIISTNKDSQKEQKDRFSIFDDRRSKVVRVELNDVREEDALVYTCGVWRNDKSDAYYSSFKDIKLLVTEKPTGLPETTSTTTFTTATTNRITSTTTNTITSATTALTTSTTEHHTGSVSVIVTVCVCVTLLLIGGIALTLKLRNAKRNDSDSTGQNIDKNKGDGGGPQGNPYNIRINKIHQNQYPDPNQSDSMYGNYDICSNQSDSMYGNYDISTNQSDSLYENFDLKTN
ncbi:CMRF35-like molecule 1, partial [Hoplias malabaricus]|uniref:CMRF35-like molecule 1 n=1 Tax=Hoplias malabaricus TaxID=27720 RepID=UPI003462048D